MYLKAMVSYTYQFGATKMGTSDAVQVQAIRENQAPKFKDGASTFRVVAEDKPLPLTTPTTTAVANAPDSDRQRRSPGRGHRR